MDTLNINQLLVSDDIQAIKIFEESLKRQLGERELFNINVSATASLFNRDMLAENLLPMEQFQLLESEELFPVTYDSI